MQKGGTDLSKEYAQRWREEKTIDVYVYKLYTHRRANPVRTIDAYVNEYKTRFKKFGAIRTSQSTEYTFLFKLPSQLQ